MIDPRPPALRVAPGLVETMLDNEFVVWDPRTGQLARMDRIGAMVWDCLDGAATVDEVSADLAYAFGVPVDVVRPDVEDLLALLWKLGLVNSEPE